MKYNRSMYTGSYSAAGITDPGKWKGENLLGFALMEVRDMLR